MRNLFFDIKKFRDLKNSCYLLIIILLSSITTFGQVGINTTSPNAILDVRSSNQAAPTNHDGILIPKIDDFPSTNPTADQDGMLIYATGNGIPSKGFYYWDNALTNWVLIAGSGGGGGGNTLDQAYDQGGNGLGRTIDASNGSVRINGEDGFLVTGTFGTGNSIDSEVTGAGTRMFFNPNKAAFRAGVVFDFPPLLGDEWDDANIGFNSTAFGVNTLASGGTSTAFGSVTSATGNTSTAFGSGTNASGDNATAFGSGTLASGAHSISFGYDTTASATSSTAFGSFTTASGTYSTAFGHQSSASSLHSIAFGSLAIASEEYAIAFGSLTEASGIGATAFGHQTTASGNYATSFGYFNTASGLYSTSFGIATTALEDRSTAFGVSNLASGDASTVFGSTNTASGDISTAFGHRTNASGNISTAFGHQNTSSGAYSTAFGRISNASGNISTTFGMATDAPSYGETAIGIYNTTYTPNSINTFNASDRLFSIGNGSSSIRSNALTIYKNGLININDAYDMPLNDGTANQVMVTNGAGVVSFQDVSILTGCTLDQAYDYGGSGFGKNIDATHGAVSINGEDGFLVTGMLSTGNTIDTEVTGAGTRMFFNPNKAAFRAGYINGNQWDNANIGVSSIAIGNNTTASGNNSTAFGLDTSATGGNSTALGSNTLASGSSATAIGENSTASGLTSVAIGSQSMATGFNTTAIGVGVVAPSYGETSVGLYNTQYTPISHRFYIASDRLFVVGNGTNDLSRNNALTIYKNGLMNINEAYDMPLTDGSTDQVMTTNGAGVVSFQDIGSIYNGNTLDAAYDEGGLGAGRIINATDGPLEVHYGGLIVESNNESHMLVVDGTTDQVGIATDSPTATLSVNGTANKPGGGSWAVFSDARLKNNISGYNEGLSLITKIRPVNFSYNSKMSSLVGNNKNLNGRVFQGVIAQELQKIAPDMVREVKIESSESYLEVDPNKFTYALINAVQEQQKEIEEQNNKIVSLENQLKEQQKEIETIKKLINNK